MATASRLSDDGSSEKLLNESDKQASDDMEGGEEEDCIKVLLSALERNEAETGEMFEDRRQLLLKNQGDFTDRGNGSVNASVSELNISKLKLNIPSNNLPPIDKKSKKMSPPQLDRQRMKLLKKHNSETGKFACGIVVMLLILGIGGSLLFLGWLRDMPDLYILGGIFSLGGIVFAIAFVVVRCQTSEQLGDTDYSVLYKA